MYTTEISVTTNMTVTHKFKVGDRIRKSYGGESTIVGIDTCDYNTYPTQIGEPIYRYEHGGWDFVSTIDPKSSLVPVPVTVGSAWRSRYWNTVFVVSEIPGEWAVKGWLFSPGSNNPRPDAYEVHTLQANFDPIERK